MKLSDEAYDELKTMREDELLAFIRDTVTQLEALGDRLETYARDIEQPSMPATEAVDRVNDGAN